MNAQAHESNAEKPSIVLVDCPDEVGLIFKITGVLSDLRVNIQSNQEFVDTNTGYFFFRAEVSAPFDVDGGCDGLMDAIQPRLQEALPKEACVRVVRSERKPIVICATREPHCLGELLLLDAVGDLPGRIVGVIANHENLRSLVERFGVPFHCVTHDGVTREEHEKSLVEIIDGYHPDVIVLARYMRVLSEQFVKRYEQRIINIHHSFLPAFAGASPYRQAFARGVKIIGATAHIVTTELDDGPIIAQDVIHIDHTFTHVRMAQAGRDVEKLVLAKAVRMVLEDRVFLHDGRTVVFETG
jgi:formyltetrahydrofolate deformylase